jgi:hypothetical protein
MKKKALPPSTAIWYIYTTDPNVNEAVVALPDVDENPAIKCADNQQRNLWRVSREQALRIYQIHSEKVTLYAKHRTLRPKPVDMSKEDHASIESLLKTGNVIKGSQVKQPAAAGTTAQTFPTAESSAPWDE